MRLNRSLKAALFLGAASLVTQSFGQDLVPTPPPAGVPAKRPRTVPMQPEPSAAPQPVPMAEDRPLPQIPENPIRLEQNLPATAEQAPLAGGLPVAAPPTSRRPVKPIGPMYYFAPNSIADNVTTPPAMHLPNSPWVEDLSVDGDHGRYVYYSYRRPWYTPGHLSANVTIVW